jgi:hypothetical protein
MRKLIILMVSLASLLSATPTRADTITAGQVFTPKQFGASFDLSGDGFSLRGAGEAFVTGCEPCRPGPHEVGIRLNGPAIGSAEVNGVSYSPAYFDLELPMLGTIDLPTDGPSAFTLRFPFTLRGGHEYISLTSARDNTPIHALLDGEGTGVIELIRSLFGGQPIYDSRSITLTFTNASSAAPTPEPATLLMVVGGTAVWGCIGRRRRSGRSTNA